MRTGACCGICTHLEAFKVVTGLFEAFLADSALLPPDWAAGAATDTGRVVRDYIAGMTDTYALSEYARVFKTEIAL